MAAALAPLELAMRLAPTDPMPRLSLAAARLQLQDHEAAAELFEAVAGETDAQAAWLGAAAARWRAGDDAAALRALGYALSRHAAGPGLVALADAVAGEAGWCGLLPDGTVRRPPGILMTFDGAVGEGPVPPGVRVVAVGAAVGSPLDIVAIRRSEGLVEAVRGGLAGWAWHPGDAARDPVLTVSDGRLTRTLVATGAEVTATGLAQPRGFALDAADLAGFSGAIAVTGADGRALSGSPLDPGAPARFAAAVAHAVAARWPAVGELVESVLADASVPAEAVAVPKTPEPRPERPVAVVVPVYAGRSDTLACLADLRATLPAGCRVIVVDDATPDPALAAALDAAPGVTLLRHPVNRGFPAAANTGLRAVAALPVPHDAVLLNADTRPPRRWLERLRDAVHAGGWGTATPLSNDASIASYPGPEGGALAPGELAARAALVARVDAAPVSAPTGVGFCLYLRHECLMETGLLREDAFAQGYGEENDLCLRAGHLGWRHALVPGVFVAHVGGTSFGAARAGLMARNAAVLERLHPGYRALVAAWIARDPLGPARRQLDLARWTTLARAAAPAALLVSHDSGGGVERCVAARVRELRAGGMWPVVLRPVLDRTATDRVYRPQRLRIDVPGAVLPNLVFDTATEWPALLRALRVARPALLEVHHLLGHDHRVVELGRRLRVPVAFRQHDYAAFCARVTLTQDGRYCGEPDVAGCRACVADHGSRLEEAIDPAALVARSAAEFAGAAVIVPSADMASRLRRHFPGLRPEVVPHAPEPEAATRVPPEPSSGRPRTVLVMGAIGPDKGVEVLLGCARDAAARLLPLRFRVMGHTSADDRLVATGVVEVTGPYEAAETAALVARQGADIGWVPSVCPETWCFTLGEMFAGGLSVLAFDLGAQAERIRATGRGWVVPLGTPVSTINNRLLTARAASGPLAVSHAIMHTA